MAGGLNTLHTKAVSSFLCLAAGLLSATLRGLVSFVYECMYAYEYLVLCWWPKDDPSAVFGTSEQSSSAASGPLLTSPAGTSWGTGVVGWQWEC